MIFLNGWIPDIVRQEVTKGHSFGYDLSLLHLRVKELIISALNSIEFHYLGHFPRDAQKLKGIGYLFMVVSIWQGIFVIVLYEFFLLSRDETLEAWDSLGQRFVE
jgi:hypothetical protein